MQPETFMSIKDIAAFLGIAGRSVHGLVTRGIITPVDSKSPMRFTRQEVWQYIPQRLHDGREFKLIASREAQKITGLGRDALCNWVEQSVVSRIQLYNKSKAVSVGKKKGCYYFVEAEIRAAMLFDTTARGSLLLSNAMAEIASDTLSERLEHAVRTGAIKSTGAHLPNPAVSSLTVRRFLVDQLYV